MSKNFPGGRLLGGGVFTVVIGGTGRNRGKVLDGRKHSVPIPPIVDLIFSLTFDSGLGRWVAQYLAPVQAYIVRDAEGRWILDPEATSGYPVVGVEGGRVAILVEP
jgi:hypothetical protein